MKRSLFILALVFSNSIFSQIVNIPDAAFKSYLVSHPVININEDTEIQVSEALAYSDSIIAVGLGIQDLTGIEAFTNLVFLSVVNNSLNSLNVQQNTQLKGLICAMNNLTTINVSQNTQLERLVFALNQNFMGLDLSNNVNLKELNFDNTSISNLDLSHQVSLEKLLCSDAELMSLNVSFCPLINTIECSSNMIMTLNTTGCTQLEKIACQGNLLTSMDLSTNVGLKSLKACCNQMTTLNVSNLINLETLDSPINNYTALDLSNNPNLTHIYLFDNQLSYLNVANGNNTGIQLLWAQNNPYECVTVDSVEYSNANWMPVSSSFAFTIGAIFSEDCSSLSVQEKGLNSIEIYPNPVLDIVSIEVKSKAKVFIYSTKGELILESEVDSEKSTIDLGGLNSGVYFINMIENAKTTELKKLIKL